MKIEMSKGDINKLICFGALITGIAMLVIGTKRKNTAKIAIKKMDDAVKDVANKTVTDISDEILHKAAERLPKELLRKQLRKFVLILAIRLLVQFQKYTILWKTTSKNACQRPQKKILTWIHLKNL